MIRDGYVRSVNIEESWLWPRMEGFETESVCISFRFTTIKVLCGPIGFATTTTTAATTTTITECLIYYEHLLAAHDALATPEKKTRRF